MTALEQAACAPTEALDLRHDALGTARLKLVTMLKDIYYLQELARTCSKFGYDLPYTDDDLSAAVRVLRTAARQVVEAQGDAS